MVQHKRPHVITNPSQVEHLGATRASNNTGELSAVCHALTGAHASWRGQVRRCSFSPTRSPDRDLHHDWRMGVAQEQKALVERPQQESPSGPTGPWYGPSGAGHDGAVPARPSACDAGHGMNDRLAAQGAQPGHAQPRRRRQDLRSDRRRRAGPRERRRRSARRAGRPPGGFGAGLIYLILSRAGGGWRERTRRVLNLLNLFIQNLRSNVLWVLGLQHNISCALKRVFSGFLLVA